MPPTDPPPGMSPSGMSPGMSPSRAADEQVTEWVLAGRYRVEAPIGTGGMGAVWRGYDQQLDRPVAVKLMHRRDTPALRPGSSEAREFIEAAQLDGERFLREIRTTARLEHPGIPAVYDTGVEQPSGRIYLVMQLLYGQTLAELIAERDYAVDPWPVSWAAAIAAQIAATLVEVHGVDVVHRDVKPTNVMITDGGSVKLLDFGVAVLRGASALPRLTQVGHTVGTPPYMSREQALGNPVGPASDVYALGCVMHEMLTGRVPFVETPSHSYRDHHVNTIPTSVRLLRPAVPAELDVLMLAMLAKRPDDRPAAEAVYETLLPFIRADDPSGRPSPADRQGTGSPTRDPRRPFLRPLGPSHRSPTSRPAPPLTVPHASAEPLDIEEAIELRRRVKRLVAEGLPNLAIDLLQDAVDRAGHDADLALEMTIELAMTLYAADEFTRAAQALDSVIDALVAQSGEEDETVLQLRYMAGVSHADIGDAVPAIAHLQLYLSHADTDDALYGDARYQLGMLLHAAGRTAEGRSELQALRPLLVTRYGENSIHVQTLDRRLEQLRDPLAGGA